MEGFVGVICFGYKFYNGGRCFVWVIMYMGKVVIYRVFGGLRGIVEDGMEVIVYVVELVCRFLVLGGFVVKICSVYLDILIKMLNNNIMFMMIVFVFYVIDCLFC